MSLASWFAGVVAAGDPVVNRFVDPLLGHNEIAIGLILRHKREDVEQVGVRLMPTHEPSGARADALDVDGEPLVVRADDHEIDRRVIAERERDLIAALAQFARDRELRRPLGEMSFVHGRLTSARRPRRALLLRDPQDDRRIVLARPAQRTEPVDPS
jgi:hypothetical protein